MDGPMMTEPLGTASVKYLEVIAPRTRAPVMKRVGLASPINHDFHVLLLHPKQLLSQLLPHHVRHASEEVCGSLGPRRNWSIDLTTRHEVTPSWDPHISLPTHPHTPKTLLCTCSLTCENTASLASSTSLSLKEPFEAHSNASWKRFRVSKEFGSLRNRQENEMKWDQPAPQ